MNSSNKEHEPQRHHDWPAERCHEELEQQEPHEDRVPEYMCQKAAWGLEASRPGATGAAWESGA